MDEQRSNEPEAETAGDNAREIVVPLLEEELSVGKRVTHKSTVRVSTVTREEDRLVDELLAREDVEVERVPVGKRVDRMPEVREEGDTIIVPVVEEVLIVQRQLHLKEEVHIRRIHATERRQESVKLRRQEAIVTRAPVENAAAMAAGNEVVGVEKENK